MRIAEVYTSGTANQQMNQIADAFVAEIQKGDPQAVVHVSVSGNKDAMTFAGTIETDHGDYFDLDDSTLEAVVSVIPDSALTEIIKAIQVTPHTHAPLKSFYTKGYATKHTDSTLPKEVELVNAIKNHLEAEFSGISAGIGLMYDESDRQIKGVTVSVFPTAHYSVENVKETLVQFVNNMPYQKGGTQIIITPTTDGGIESGTFGQSGMNSAQEFFGQEEAHVTISLRGCSANSFESKGSNYALVKAREILATHHEKPDEVQVELTYIQGVPSPIAGYVYITVGSNENRYDLSSFK